MNTKLKGRPQLQQFSVSIHFYSFDVFQHVELLISSYLNLAQVFQNEANVNINSFVTHQFIMNMVSCYLTYVPREYDVIFLQFRHNVSK